MSLLLDAWGDFCNWISTDWSDTTFYIVMAVMMAIGLLTLVTFIKSSYGKDGKIRWMQLIFAIIFLGLTTVLCIAKFT